MKRIVKSEYGNKKWVKIERFICRRCGFIHRELPKSLYPYKHYEARIIDGVVQGMITSYDLEYEDYPCEMTMERWKRSRILQDL